MPAASTLEESAHSLALLLSRLFGRIAVGQVQQLQGLAQIQIWDHMALSSLGNSMDHHVAAAGHDLEQALGHGTRTIRSRGTATVLIRYP